MQRDDSVLWRPRHAGYFAGLLAGCLAGLVAACGASGPEEGIVVGVVLDYVGDTSANGFNVERGALLAAQLMAPARADDMPLRLEFRDAQGDPSRAARVTEELIALGAVAILGPSNDALVQSVLDVAGPADVLLVSPTATAGGITTDAPWFRLSPGNSTGSSAATLMGESLAKEMRRRDIVRVGVVGQDDTYDREFVGAFIDTFVDLGGSLAAEPQTVNDNATLAAAVNHPFVSDGDKDGFVVATNVSLAAKFITEVTARSGGVPGWFLTPHLKSEVLLLNTPVGVLDGALGVSPRIAYLHQACDEDADDQCFLGQYHARWEDEPFEDTYFMYDSTALTCIAIDRVLRAGDELDAQRLTTAVLDIANQGGVQVGWNNFDTAVDMNREGTGLQFTGLTGPILFSLAGARLSGNGVFWQIDGNRIVDDEAANP